MPSSQLTNQVTYPKPFQPLFEKHYPVVRLYGGRMSCKSWTTALYLCGRLMSSPCRVLCTREVQKSIKESSHYLMKNLISQFGFVGFDITDTAITHQCGSDVIFWGLKGGSKTETESRMKSLEDVKYVWIEEGQSASVDSIVMIYDTLVRKKNFQLIITMNPLYNTDGPTEFLKTLDPKDVLDLKVNYYDVKDFLPKDAVKEADRLKKSDYEEWLWRYDGNPRTMGDDVIIPLKKITAATERKPDDEGGVIVGIDVARFGDDLTVFVKRKGHAVIDMKEFQKKSITEVFAEAKVFCDNADQINVDDSGVGGGLTDLMMDAGYDVNPINFGEKAFDSDKYNNRISELWFELPIDKITIPKHERLKNELATRKYTYDTKARRCVESKKDYKKRGFSSPDYADALLLAFAQEGESFDFGNIETGGGKKK